MEQEKVASIDNYIRNLSEIRKHLLHGLNGLTREERDILLELLAKELNRVEDREKDVLSYCLMKRKK